MRVVKEMLTSKADKADVDKILSSQDGIAKQIKDYYQEMVFLVRRVGVNGRLDKKSLYSFKNFL